MAAGVIERIGAGLEWIVYGPFATVYRRFVYLILVTTAVLVVVNGLVTAGMLSTDPGVATALWTAGEIAVTLFALTAIVQLVVLARTFQRGTEKVAETAAELESAAADVEATADELETTAETVETAAEEVETAASDVTAVAEEASDIAEPEEVAERVTDATEVADEVRSETAAAKQTTEAAKETVSEAKAIAESERQRLPADVEGPEESDDKVTNDSASDSN